MLTDVCVCENADWNGMPVGLERQLGAGWKIWFVYQKPLEKYFKVSQLVRSKLRGTSYGYEFL